MKKHFRALVFVVLAVGLAATCSAGYSETTRMKMKKPTAGTLNWGTGYYNPNFDLIDSMVALLGGPNIFIGSNTFTGLNVFDTLSATTSVVSPSIEFSGSLDVSADKDQEGSGILTLGIGHTPAFSADNDMAGGVGNVTIGSDWSGVGGKSISMNVGGVEVISISTTSVQIQSLLSARDLSVTYGVVAGSLDTGQGAGELYGMDQAVMTTSSPTFAQVTVTSGFIGDGSGLTNLPASGDTIYPSTATASFPFGFSSSTGNVTGLLSAGTVTAGIGNFGDGTNVTDGNNAFAGGGSGNHIHGSMCGTAGGFGNTLYGNYNGALATHNNFSGISTADVGFVACTENFIGGDVNKYVVQSAIIAGEYNKIGDVNGNYSGSLILASDWSKINANHAMIFSSTQATNTGNYSAAGGFRVKNSHSGTFIWADSTNADFASAANDEFAVRASGGFRVVGTGNFSGAVSISSSCSVGISTSSLNLSLNQKTSTGASLGTLTNAPVAGDPTGYVSITINGVEARIPYWVVP
jgi:hypothetical protein